MTNRVEDITGTTISFRISYKSKQQLLKIAEEVERSCGTPATLTDIIKTAVQETWGINLYKEK